MKQISDNEICLLIKYIKSVLWRVAKCLSYIEEARCLKVNDQRSWVARCKCALSTRPSVQNKTGKNWMDFHEISCRRTSWKMVKLLQFWLKTREIMATLRKHIQGFLYLLFTIRDFHGLVYLFISGCLCWTGLDELYILWTVLRDTYRINWNKLVIKIVHLVGYPCVQPWWVFLSEILKDKF